MKMKRFLSILLASLLLGTRVGFALNVHYCGDHISKVSLAYSPENCGMEKGKETQIPNALKFSKKSCCEDDVLLFQNHEPQNKHPEVQPKDAPLFVQATVPVNKIENRVLPFVFKPIHWIPPPRPNKLFLLQHTLVFYD